MRRTFVDPTELENQLKMALQQKANHTNVPNEVTQKIEQLFEHHFAFADEQNQSNKEATSIAPDSQKYTFRLLMKRIIDRFRWRTAALLLSIMIILSGGAYASNMVYSITTGEMLLTFDSQNSYTITPEQTTQYREMTDHIMAQLQPGQSAYVYSSLFSKLGMNSVVIFTKPKSYSSIIQLQQAMQSSLPIFPKPSDIPADYEFTYGSDVSWIEDNIVYGGEPKLRLIRGLLQNKLSHPTTNYAWMPIPTQDEEDMVRPTALPRLMYTSSTGHTLSITIGNLDDTVNNRMELVAPNQTNVSIVSSTKGKMLYTSTEHSYIDFTHQPGLSTIYALNWNEKKKENGSLWSITISSDDPNISQAELVRIAERIQ